MQGETASFQKLDECEIVVPYLQGVVLHRINGTLTEMRAEIQRDKSLDRKSVV